MCVCSPAVCFFSFIRTVAHNPGRVYLSLQDFSTHARACQSLNWNSNGPWMCVQLKNIIEQADLFHNWGWAFVCVCVYVCELSGFVCYVLNEYIVY